MGLKSPPVTHSNAYQSSFSLVRADVVTSRPFICTHYSPRAGGEALDVLNRKAGKCIYFTITTLVDSSRCY